jgi:OMF family outer membrane factor
LAESSEAEVAASVDDLVVTALQERPDVQQALAEVRASGHALSFARATNAPSVSVFSTFSTRGTQDPLLNQTGSVGVNFRWTLSDGGLGAGRTREARAQLESSRALLESLQQTVVGEVVQAHVDLEAAEQRLLTAQAQVANAQELLRISTGRYQGEVGTFLEVTDAQDAVFSAERNLANALADVQVARAALRLAVGRA